MGNLVRIKQPVARVVALTTDHIEVLRILKADGLLVGVCDLVKNGPEYWPEFQHLPGVGKRAAPNEEAIVNLMPDLVLSYGRSPGAELEDKVGSLGIRILRLDCFRLSTFKSEVELLGRVLNREKEAEEYLAWMQDKLDMAAALTKGLPRTKVYMESYGDFAASGKGSPWTEMCHAAGGFSIGAMASIPNAQVATEWIMSMAPDVVMKASMVMDGYGAKDDKKLERVHNNLLRRPGWGLLPPVKNGRVHVLASPIGPGPRSVVGVCYMAKWLHPEACKNLSPEAVHAEYLERFQGMPYQGSHVYP